MCFLRATHLLNTSPNKNFHQLTQVEQPTVVVLIPTCNSDIQWETFLKALSAQSLRPSRCVVIDSESNDGTAELALNHCMTVHRISRAEFNHGTTRQLGQSALDLFTLSVRVV